jgi:membrane protein
VTIKSVAAQARLRIQRARADYGAVDIAIRTWRRYSEDDGGFYAASLTYYTFFSIFPLLIFCASVLGYLAFLSRDFRESLLERGLEAVPLLSEILSPDSIDTLQQQRGTLAVVGLVLALYTGSGAIVALEHSLNKIYRVLEEPGFLATRIRSFKWLGITALAAVVSIGLGIAAQFAGNLIDGAAVVTIAVSLLVHALGALLSVGIFMAAFKLLPAIKQSWRDVAPGAIGAGVAFEILKSVGAWYLARGAGSRAQTFGAFEAAAALLVASYLLSQIVLLAAEVNAVLAERRSMRQSALDPGSFEEQRS